MIAEEIAVKMVQLVRYFIYFRSSIAMIARQINYRVGYAEYCLKGSFQEPC